MEEFDGRINDSGQPVASMTIPFTSLRGGWVQDCDMKWHRLIVPSGHEQLIRSVYRPWRCAGRDLVLNKARWCAESVGNLDAEAAEIIDIVTAFENKKIKLGGKEEHDNHNKLLRYVITHKMVEKAGCIVCPACLSETPTKFSIYLKCKGMMMSHGRRPVEIKIEDESGDEDEMEVDESIGVEQEPTEDQKEEYKDAKRLIPQMHMASVKRRSIMVEAMKMLKWKPTTKEKKKNNRMKIQKCRTRTRRKERNTKHFWRSSPNGHIHWRSESRQCRSKTCPTSTQ